MRIPRMKMPPAPKSPRLMTPRPMRPPKDVMEQSEMAQRLHARTEEAGNIENQQPYMPPIDINGNGRR